MNCDSQLNPTEQYVALKYIERNLYNFRWFDLSQFNGVYDGEQVSTYNSGLQQTLVSFKNSDRATAALQPVFSQVLFQSRNYEQVQWSVLSMDIILGMIGGFVGLIYLLLTWAIGDYQRFKFTTALISEAYSTTEKSRMCEGNEP